MGKEYEVSILDIDVFDFEKRLNKLGAKKNGDFLQKRYVYDFNPEINNKWIRLRTNGKKTTITIKEIFDESIVGGTNELEIEVSDFEKTNQLLNELGYKEKGYQENKRTIYDIDEIEVSIDSWPMIPTYAEIEGKNEKSVKEFLKRLNINEEKVTTLGVTSIYEAITLILNNMTF